jgi:predicted PurR-regulated permease PerM
MFSIGKVEELVILLTMAAILAFVVWMLVHVINNKRLTAGWKLLWILAVIFIYPFAAMYYFYWASVYKREKPASTAK